MASTQQKKTDVSHGKKIVTHRSVWMIVFGMIGGVVGGLVMAGIGYGLPIPMMHNEPFFIAAVDMMMMGSIVLTGWTLHVVTSVVVGALFGLITAKVASLRVTSYARGLLWGVATGVLTYCLLFLPTILSPMASLFSNSGFMLESLGYNLVFGLILGLSVVGLSKSKFREV